MNEAVEQKLLRLAGLGVRARTAVVGVEQVRRAAERGKANLVLVAADVSANSRDKVIPLLSARGVEMLEMPSAARLGAVAGKASTAAIGILDPRLARGMREAVKTERSAAADREGSVGGMG